MTEEFNLELISKKYPWGWSLWIKTNGSKVLIANRLKDKQAVRDFAIKLSYAPIIIEKTTKEEE